MCCQQPRIDSIKTFIIFKFGLIRLIIRIPNSSSMVTNRELNRAIIDSSFHLFVKSGQVTANLLFLSKKQLYKPFDEGGQEILDCQRVPTQLQQVLWWKQGNDFPRLHKGRASSKSWWLGRVTFWYYWNQKARRHGWEEEQYGKRMGRKSALTVLQLR